MKQYPKFGPEYKHAWYLANKERYKPRYKKYARKHRKKIKRYHRKWHLNWKEEISKETFAHYGEKCYCCGEKDWRFLTLDHVNNDGAEHRRTMKCHGGTAFYKWLKEHNWPNRPKLQVACFNCNCSKWRNCGHCAHEDD